MRYTFRVNNHPHTVDVAPETPLLWVLRDHLNLRGTKFGCGLGVCGACTVHLEGQTIRSCQTPVSTIGDAAVTTIEGLHPTGEHPLQQSWSKLDVAQCGYCQSGQLMSAAALLKRNPHPTATDIDAALAGNLCRCGTHLRIRAAVTRAAESLLSPSH
jgi:isoquinoline 1-oxidoreductase alpha subunit